MSQIPYDQAVNVPTRVPYGEHTRANFNLGDTIPAGAWSLSPYEGHKSCKANEETCKGPKVKGEDYCIGHLRSFGLR